MKYMNSSREKCVNDIRTHCKRNYLLHGSVTSTQGRKKCKQTLKDMGVWGRDKSVKCKEDLECNHQGCAEEEETYDSFKQIVNEVAPSLPSNMNVLKNKIQSHSTTAANHLKRSTMAYFTRKNNTNTNNASKRNANNASKRNTNSASKRNTNNASKRNTNNASKRNANYDNSNNTINGAKNIMKVGGKQKTKRKKHGTRKK